MKKEREKKKRERERERERERQRDRETETERARESRKLEETCKYEQSGEQKVVHTHTKKGRKREREIGHSKGT